ncbi:MAG TPA: hypothetical protein VN809_16440 [Telmatospirillum sp.]|nr:hypothetical protein [Telmatospirillum sp.]
MEDGRHHHVIGIDRITAIPGESVIPSDVEMSRTGLRKRLKPAGAAAQFVGGQLRRELFHQRGDIFKGRGYGSLQAGDFLAHCGFAIH